jgi:hypothetical protein
MSDRRIEDMSIFEQARWYSLMEAINIIADECEERGKAFDKIKISPLDIEKYIEGTCDIFARKIFEEKRLENQHHSGLMLDIHDLTEKTDKVMV